MARIICIASLVLAAVSTVSGHVIPHKRVHHPPAGWQSDILQNYGDYHDRYLQWDCEGQHNTTFFEKCCHPLLKKESISVLESLGCGSPSGDNCDDGNSSALPSSASPSPLHPMYTTPSYTPSSSSSSPTTPAETAKDNVAPHAAPTSTPTPTTTPEKAPASSSSPAPAPAQTAGSGGQVNTGGVATWFTQDNTAGACGQVHSDNDLICAIDQGRYGSSGGASRLCGQQVLITAVDSGKTVTVTIADDCPTCDNDNSIDLSKGAFQQLAALSVGEVPISWKFL